MDPIAAAEQRAREMLEQAREEAERIRRAARQAEDVREAERLAEKDYTAGPTGSQSRTGAYVRDVVGSATSRSGRGGATKTSGRGGATK